MTVFRVVWRQREVIESRLRDKLARGKLITFDNFVIDRIKQFIVVNAKILIVC